MFTKSPVTPQHNKAMEIYFVLADIVERDLIPSEVRYEGRECITTDTGNKYRLVGGVANTDWILVSTGAGSGVISEENFTVDAIIAANGFIDLLENPNEVTGHLFVFYDGFINQEGGADDYTQPNPNRINFNYPLVLGAKIKIKYSY